MEASARHAGPGPRQGLRVVLAGLVACAALFAAGCAGRTVQEKVWDRDAVQVFLRKRIEKGVVVDRGFQHPSAVSEQRLSHVLGALEIETPAKDGKLRERRRAIHPEMLMPIAKGLSAALEKADETQEVAVLAVRKERRLGLFHKLYLTSFVAWVKNDRLYVHLSRVDHEIPKDREDDTLPQPRVGEKQMAFKVVVGRKMRPAGPQTVSIRWRDPLFSQPVRFAGDAAAGGRGRRTVIMESPLPADEVDPDVVQDLSPDTLRALADLEEARRAGRITEAEYQDRRENLLGSFGD